MELIIGSVISGSGINLHFYCDKKTRTFLPSLRGKEAAINASLATQAISRRAYLLIL